MYEIDLKYKFVIIKIKINFNSIADLGMYHDNGQRVYL